MNIMEQLKPKLQIHTRDSTIVSSFQKEEKKEELNFDALLDLKTIDPNSIITLLEQKMEERQKILQGKIKR